MIEQFDDSSPLPATSLRAIPYADFTAVLILLILALATFWPVVGFDFLAWDDLLHLSGNPLFHPPALSHIGRFWTTPFYGLYIPVTYTIWMLIACAAGLDPAVFHAANLLVHLACVVLVYAILLRLAGSAWGAAAGAAIFAVHPLQVETVAWVSAFRDLLSGMFVLMAVWIDLRPGNRAWRYPLILLAFVLAILAKPTAVVLPILLLLLRWMRKQDWRQAAIEIGPLVLLSIACALWTRMVQPSTDVHPAPAWFRPLVAADALAFYLFKLLWPTRLGLDYGRTPQAILSNGQAWFTWVMPASVIVMMLGVLRAERASNRLYIGAGLIFVAGLLPVLGLVSFDFQGKSTVADHYVYVSMLGVALAVALFVCGRNPPGLRPVTKQAAVLGIILILSARSFIQTWSWHDTRRLAEDGLRVNPRSWSAMNLLAWNAFDANDPRQAQWLSSESLRIRDDNPDALINLGIALAEQGRLRQAVEPLEIAIQLRPRLADAHATLAGVYGKLGRYDEALDECKTALKLNPNHPQAKLTLELLRRAMAPPATSGSRQ